MKMAYLKRIIWVLLAVYITACGVIYYKQKSMLFPTQYAQAVPANWQPTAGDSQMQALIAGSCGKINVALWRIKNAKGTIMMNHGNGESLASINDYAYAFHNLGYNLMAWDYAGYGQSTACWFSQTDLLNDAESAYQWLARQEKQEKIFIFGYSVGAGIALSVAAHHQQNPVFLVAGYDSLANVAKDNISPLVPIRFLARYPIETAPFISLIQQPIYMIHGTADKLIRPARAQALEDASQGKAHLEWVQGAGHTDDTLFIYRNQWLKRLLP